MEAVFVLYQFIGDIAPWWLRVALALISLVLSTSVIIVIGGFSPLDPS